MLEENWVFLLDRIRDVRHMDQHALEHFAAEEEACSTFKSAKSFVKRMMQLFVRILKTNCSQYMNKICNW